jgi:hypothetical protein
MLLDDIYDYLTSAGGGEWTSANLFKGSLPAAPDTCTAVYETGGLPSVHAFNALAGQAKVEQPRIQVVCRAAGYATARVAAHKAFKLLDGLPTRDINGVGYQWGAAVQSPFAMGRDKQDRELVACNYDIVKRLSTTS